MTGLRLKEGEIHEDIPERRVKAVHHRECNEERQILARIFDAVDAEEYSRENARRVLSGVDEMRKDILRVSITSDALQKTPGYES